MRRDFSPNVALSNSYAEDLAKRRRDWSHDPALARRNPLIYDPPTVASIEVQDGQNPCNRNRYHMNDMGLGTKDLRDGKLSKIIEDSRSAASSAL